MFANHLAGFICLLAGVILALAALYGAFRSEIKKAGRFQGWPGRIGYAVWLGCAIGLMVSGYQRIRLP